MDKIVLFNWILFIIGCFGLSHYARNLNQDYSGLLLCISVIFVVYGICGRLIYED